VCFEQISASTYSDAKKRGHASARVTFPAVYLLEAADNFVEFNNADYLSLSISSQQSSGTEILSDDDERSARRRQLDRLLQWVGPANCWSAIKTDARSGNHDVAILCI